MRTRLQNSAQYIINSKVLRWCREGSTTLSLWSFCCLLHNSIIVSQCLWPSYLCSRWHSKLQKQTWSGSQVALEYRGWEIFSGRHHFWLYNISSALSFITFWANLAVDKFLFFPESRLWHFMQHVSSGDNLPGMLKPLFWEKIRKKNQIFFCWKLSINFFFADKYHSNPKY